MITDRELDIQLASAAGVDDADLPALPETFLGVLQATEPAESEPASVIAARQLVSDAWNARVVTPMRRRRPGRTALVRVGVAVLAVAAAWTTAVVVASDRPTTERAPAATPNGGTTAPTDMGTPFGSAEPNGMKLVSAEQVTFPLSVDPVPDGLTPTFMRSGGPTPFGESPVIWNVAYRSAEGAGFGFSISPEDPREEWDVEHELPQWGYESSEIIETATVTVGGAAADLVRGVYDRPSCTYAPSTPTQTEEPEEVCTHSFADLFWERPDGRWIWLRGEDKYSDAAAVVAVAESIIDRPQSVDLQLRLAPAGWSLNSYDETGLGFVDGDDPNRRIAVWLMERWRRETVENAFQGMYDGPEHWTTVNGRPAKVVLVDQGGLREWFLAGELNGGVLFGMQMPESFTQEQILELASQVTYTR